MEARLKWAKAHKDWTEDDWRRMVFSDETKINVWGSDGCKYFWRRPGDKLQPHHLDLTVKGGAGSVMLWGCMTCNGPGYACTIEDGTMKASDHVHILSTTLMDSLNYYGYKQEAIYFQQDTVRDKISPFFGFFAMPRRELNLGLRFADETFARKLDKIIGVT
ncbi:hypothetical protein G6F22_015153 [Rhizopus arrhizus]|nr:hypothetical protein G6F22_015153 [Rhizopus arrhizus]KAG0812285.1 hypothetical protein G6F18_013424 [Rhizopus arrhizus]KAG1059323.1 hypothetical protein G6F41_013503 [Rhizopus arrhizus]KAG1085992.1 hypothetical protein G6F40_014050 [Rhizopus arrhizus]KAG1175322.1 hypothetical protein G6F35_016577 [Rhizopus arrhizus]